jgi:O-antigen ligase
MVLAAPPLYFPSRFPPWMQVASLGLLLLGLLWRRYRLGQWFPPTPADLPLWLWFLVLLPMSVVVAPPYLRDKYSLPRAMILVWNFYLFWLVAAHACRGKAGRRMLAGLFITAGTAIAVAALFGTAWGSKLPLLSPLLARLPSTLVGTFEGAEAGFSPNQIAGSLLFVLPFAMALVAAEFRRCRRAYILLPLLGACGVMGLVLFATQSRTGFFGFCVSIVVLAFAPFRWGRRLLVGGALILVLCSALLPTAQLLLELDRSTRFDGTTQGVNMAGRYEIWQSAIAGIQSYPFTGMGLGTFRQLAPLLYPFATIPHTYDIAHAHNFFLQLGLDFGIVGLVAVLAVYLITAVQAAVLWQTAPFAGSRAWAIGLVASLIGQTVYSLADVVAMGAKPNFLAWYLWAFVIGLSLTKEKT